MHRSALLEYVDLGETFHMSIYYLLAKVGFDTAETSLVKFARSPCTDRPGGSEFCGKLRPRQHDLHHRVPVCDRHLRHELLSPREGVPPSARDPVRRRQREEGEGQRGDHAPGSRAADELKQPASHRAF